ncbi:MAG: hypothetical protein ACRDMU_08580 [Gaiellaceae bacterium]
MTIAKLRWLLGKATAVLGETRLADLSPRDMYAWRLTIPEGHRFEATQALRQVLNRAVDWGLLDSNPAKRGIRNTPRRAREKRPFESWQQLEAVAARMGPVYGRMVVFAAATGLRPSELFGLEWRDVDRAAGVVYVRRAYANGLLQAHEDSAQQPRGSVAGEGARGARPASAFRQRDPVSERSWWADRLPQLRPPPLEARAESSRDRAAARSL